ncbi:RHS repeat-associated core domain-containing protein [Actinocrispum sp. NPDC049592]|uniref:RHS repeat domain-containing protein n=1 Tax=Actinocrispum sp. NPDC049592 TaxID=3154835 RepID=UPI003419070E
MHRRRATLLTAVIVATLTITSPAGATPTRQPGDPDPLSKSTFLTPKSVPPKAIPSSVSADRALKPPTAKAPGGAPVQSASADRSTVDFDYAATDLPESRLQVFALPACATTTPDRAECRTRTPLPTRNDPKARKASAETATAPANSVFALAAAPNGPAGDYRATPLSDSATWNVGIQAGTFTWSYPIAQPPVPGGLVPDVSLDYSSASVDGRTASANAQPSWVGEGFDLAGGGQITWRFKGCANDGVKPVTGDLCWAGDYAAMTLGSKAMDLVLDGGVWHAKNDDTMRIEQLHNSGNGDTGGDAWKVTTNDGTQYFFGTRAAAKSTWTVPVFGNNDGEPCHAGTFAASACPQAWTWNLDYVVDRHSDSMSYFYDTESNSYGQNLAATKADYIRSGWLKRIEFGTRDGVADTAPAKVEFTAADRCVPGADCSQHTKDVWPDVPWDQVCTDNKCADKLSPTFFSTKRLASVSTSVLVNGAYQTVDTWDLKHQLPDPGDKSSAALWLAQIVHTGKAGDATGIAEPPVYFGGTPLPNRVNSGSDGLLTMNKYRLTSITTPSGGVVQVTYKPSDCLPDPDRKAETNHGRCFPVYWSYDGAAPQNDWFNKYVVSTVQKIDLVGGAFTEVTNYDYPDGAAAWHFNDDPLIPAERRNWTTWRGYDLVTVRHGDPKTDSTKESRTEYRYFRGMNGDKNGGMQPVQVTDSQGTAMDDNDGLEGVERERRLFDGTAEVSGTITDPKLVKTATQGTKSAYRERADKVFTRTALAAGGFRRTEVDNTYDDYGFLSQVNDLGDTAVSSDDRCTTNTYARNTDAWVLGLTSRVRTLGVKCGAPARFPDDNISDVQTYYDTKAYGVLDGPGDVTKSEKVASFAGAAPVYVTDSTAKHDPYGRTIEATDAINRTTTTAYNGLTTVDKDPAGNPTTTTYDPYRHQKLSIVDVNQRRTDLAYDPLGRLTGVWQPGRSKAARQGPNTRYTYSVTGTAPSSVLTETLQPKLNYQPSYAIYDGFLRPRQTQSPAWMLPGNIARVVTDTFYDTRGLAVKQNQPYLFSGAAAGGLIWSPNGDGDVPGQTLTTYDGAERPVKAEFRSANVPKWSTLTEYRGDRTVVTPPDGGIKTTTVTDARGNTTELDQAADATKYGYTKAGQQNSLTDPAGNTWTSTFDVRGRQITVDDPDKGHTGKTYDDAGQLTSTTDARGQKLFYDYDNLGRKKAVHADRPDGPVLDRWDYDPANAIGQLASNTHYANGTAYVTKITGYDAGYHPTGTETTIPASTDPAENKLAGKYTTSTSYSPQGAIISETLPAIGGLPAETVQYGYDDYGKPSTLVGADTYVGLTRYTPFGEPEMVRMGVEGKETWERRAYDDATRRPKQSVVETRISTDYQSDVSYGYDPAGNVKSQLTKIIGTADDQQCFGYDYLRRLTEVWTSGNQCQGAAGSSVSGPAPYWTTYGYDLVGNRKSETNHGLGAADTVRTTTYPDAKQPRPHAPVKSESKGPQGTKTDNFDYNAVGSTTSRPGTSTMVWDQQNRLVSTSAQTAYVQDTDGTKLVNRDASGATLFLGGTELRTDKGTGAVVGTRYYRSNGEVVGARNGAGLNWLIHDGHNSDTVAVNASSLQVLTRRLDQFGELRQAQPANWPVGRGFVGGQQDPATGLTTLGVRDYDPDTGKFLSVDPVLNTSNPQQFNGFSYANNNPTTMSDPDGRYLRACVVDTNVCAPPPPPAPPQNAPVAPGGTTWPGFGPPGPRANCMGPLYPQSCVIKTNAKAQAEYEKERAREAAMKLAMLQKPPSGATLDCFNWSATVVIFSFGGSKCEITSGPDKGKHIDGNSYGLGIGLGFEAGHSNKWSSNETAADIAGYDLTLAGGVGIGVIGLSGGAGVSTTHPVFHDDVNEFDEMLKPPWERRATILEPIGPYTGVEFDGGWSLGAGADVTLTEGNTWVREDNP